MIIEITLDKKDLNKVKFIKNVLNLDEFIKIVEIRDNYIKIRTADVYFVELLKEFYIFLNFLQSWREKNLEKFNYNRKD